LVAKCGGGVGGKGVAVAVDLGDFATGKQEAEFVEEAVAEVFREF